MNNRSGKEGEFKRYPEWSVQEVSKGEAVAKT